MMISLRMNNIAVLTFTQNCDLPETLKKEFRFIEDELKMQIYDKQ